MKKHIFTLFTLVAMSITVSAKTLVVYYSYTNNVESIVNELNTQIDCDVVEIEPTEKGLDYAANNYAIGSSQIAAIRNNPDDASSYPSIDPVEVDLDEYDTVIIGAPLWWSQMAAPLQAYLFHNGAKMAGKNIGLIISSASSGISGVVADAKRLIPEGKFLEPNLWIRSYQTSNSHTLIEQWLKDINYFKLQAGVEENFIAGGSVKGIEIYRLDGIRMDSDMAMLPKGIYLLRQGNNSKKVRL